MFRFKSSLSDRVNFDEAAFAWADECIRAAEVPPYEIEIEEFAREKFELEREQIEAQVDDIEEAKARCLDAFRRAWLIALRENVEEVQLLQMPSEDSLEVLGDAAGHYGDNGGAPDGDLWLAPAERFSPDQIARAISAGGRVVDGYAVEYPECVAIDPRARTPLGPGWVAARGWCGYGIDRVAYALDPDVAAVVYAASQLRAKEEREQEKDSPLEHLKVALKAYSHESTSWLEPTLSALDAARARSLREILGALDPTTSMRVRRILADLREQGSDDAVRAMVAIAKGLPDCLDAYEFAIRCAQARAGAHPCPNELLEGMDLDQEGLCFSGPAWRFWGERSEEAIRAARKGFAATVLHEAGLGDEPLPPESIAPARVEPEQIAPGVPEALSELIDELKRAKEEDDEDGQINTLRAIADAEASSTPAAVDESLWAALSDELREFAKQHDIGIGARLSALIDVALGCPNCWRKADRIRDDLIEALLAREAE